MINGEETASDYCGALGIRIRATKVEEQKVKNSTYVRNSK